MGLTILILEDEVFIASELREALWSVGATVLYARTLARAMRLVEETEFGGAILDVTLGYDSTCEPVAVALERSGTPFVLHSGDLLRQGEMIETIDAPLVPKPAAARDVVAELGRTISAAAVF